ncbi:MAG: Small, acid-soluble spore protein C2 [Candidatus Dichloromethanomonas elyunquensis]|nr:MAG: Small, acid-soluble spore protein C2 [Candidatus Dichloromethanomonas elyunquensis]
MGKGNSALDQLKYEVSSELGYINADPKDTKYEVSGELGIQSGSGYNKAVQDKYSQFLNNAKYEVANELGIQFNKGYNGDITSRDAGRIGGRIGGKIGGNMVRKMIEYAENHMQNTGKL